MPTTRSQRHLAELIGKNLKREDPYTTAEMNLEIERLVEGIKAESDMATLAAYGEHEYDEGEDFITDTSASKKANRAAALYSQGWFKVKGRFAGPDENMTEYWMHDSHLRFKGKELMNRPPEADPAGHLR